MYTLHEVILSYMKLSNNSKQTGYAQLREAAELALYKIYKNTRESFVRKWTSVNNGIAEIPCSLENLLGVYVVDECGDTKALFEDNFINTLPRPALKCKCNSCDTNECMCPTVQDNIVSTDVVFGNEIYQNKLITRVLKNGEIVEYKMEWVPKYNAAQELVDIIPVETQQTKCVLSVKSCGCTTNNEENISKLLGCGCIIDLCIPSLRQDYPALANDYGYYQYDHQLKTLHIFNSRGKKSRLRQVILSYQSSGADILIPLYVRPALIALLDWTKKMYSPLYSDGDRDGAKRNFKREETEMIRYLHPIPYEIIVQSGDFNAMNNHNNRRIPSSLFHEEPKELAPSCNNPVVNAPTTVINNNTYTTIIQGEQYYDFDVENDATTDFVLSDLRCNRITTIKVDGIGRKLKIVAEDDITVPAENTFYWRIASGRLTYGPSGLNKDQWVEITYKAVENCTPI